MTITLEITDLQTREIARIAADLTIQRMLSGAIAQPWVPDRMLTLNDVEKHLNLKKSTMRDEIKMGKIQAIQMGVGRNARTYVAYKDLLDYINRKKTSRVDKSE